MSNKELTKNNNELLFDLPLDNIEFLGRSNHTSPITIEGVAEAELIQSQPNAPKNGYVMIYTVCNIQHKIGISEDLYNKLKNVFDFLKDKHNNEMEAWANKSLEDIR